jgi:Integrase zinc binding domain
MIAGHPGILKTLQLVAKDYWWPQMRDFINNYVKGCATCQSTKSRTIRLKIPIFLITTNKEVTPFQTVAMDLITDLEPVGQYDSILTIMDHDCTKATVFVPCNKEINAPGIVALYAQSMFAYYGLPRKVISDRDTRATTHFTKELCKLLDIKQNISIVYHPETDGQSE